MHGAVLVAVLEGKDKIVAGVAVDPPGFIPGGLRPRALQQSERKPDKCDRGQRRVRGERTGAPAATTRLDSNKNQATKQATPARSSACRPIQMLVWRISASTRRHGRLSTAASSAPPVAPRLLAER